jgi:hypothetical protein
MMRQSPLPTELSHFAHLPDLQYQGSGEWSSACPMCGGAGHRHDASDRFRLFAADSKGNARAWCRQCHHFEWADQDSKQRPSAEEIERARLIRERLLEDENRRLRSRIQELRQEAYWKGYHDAMREGHRALWRQAGIPNEFQDYWELGFVEKKRIKHNGDDYTTPALSIPYFTPGREPVNIQYRLTNPPNPSDKYRFSYGLKPDLWLAEPDEQPKNAVLLMEGMKKAAVSFIQVVASGHGKFSVVAMPSKHPQQHMIAKLKDCDPVYVILDPDAYTGPNPSAQRLGDMLEDRARFVRLPAKADDLFVEYGFTPKMFLSYVNSSSKAI